MPRDASGSASTEERAKAASVVAAPAVTSHIVPEANALEAAVVQGLRVHPARHFGEVVAWMRGTTESPTRLPQAALASDASVLDLADVAGQEHARRALEVAAAGGHNLLLFRPPGSGKTILRAGCRGSCPPSLTFEALEATVVHSIAGLTRDRGFLVERAFCAPHHSVSDAGRVRGSNVLRPGEVSLALHRIVFLDELQWFRRPGSETVSRHRHPGSVQFRSCVEYKPHSSCS